MSFDRSQKKPHDYRVPAGRQRCAPAFADSDRLMIDGARLCSTIETGPGAAPVDPPPVPQAPSSPPAVLPAPPPPDRTPLLRLVALPAVCVVIGLILGIAIGRATAPDALPPASQQEAPAAPASATEGDGVATPGAEHPAGDQASSEGRQPDDAPGSDPAAAARMVAERLEARISQR